MSSVESTGGGAAVAVSMPVALLALLASCVGGLVVFGAISSVCVAAVRIVPGGSVVKVVVFAFGAVVLGAVIMVPTAAMFSFSLGAFSHHFFFWEHLPCPGPGMLSTKTEGDSSELVLDFKAGSVVLVPWLVLVLCDL